MKIVFHGSNALTFREGFELLLDHSHEIAEVPDDLRSDSDKSIFAEADVIVGVRFDRTLPKPRDLKLFQVPGAGYEGIDRSALPGSAMLCNCFGHENAIAEYVLAALLSYHVPLRDADHRLRNGDWEYWAGGPSSLRTELSETTLGIIGFGHIGKTLAARAKAFGMKVLVANRSTVTASENVDKAYSLDELLPFMGKADAIVNTLPLTPETHGLIGLEAFARMSPDAVIVNVGRGAVIDEAALFSALKDRRIRGAVIDTWYVYPNGENATPLPSNLPFHELDNILMTPHMSGWTFGTVRRRKETIANNVNRLAAGLAPDNIIT